MEYNIQGWLTAKNSELFEMSLDYYNKWGRIDDVSPSYTGNITSWQWQHKGDPTGNGPQNRYNFTYDDLSQLTNTDQYVNNEKTRQNVERCLSYDRNGNFKLLFVMRMAPVYRTAPIIIRGIDLFRIVREQSSNGRT